MFEGDNISVSCNDVSQMFTKRFVSSRNRLLPVVCNYHSQCLFNGCVVLLSKKYRCTLGQNYNYCDSIINGIIIVSL